MTQVSGSITPIESDNLDRLIQGSNITLLLENPTLESNALIPIPSHDQKQSAQQQMSVSEVMESSNNQISDDEPVSQEANEPFCHPPVQSALEFTSSSTVGPLSEFLPQRRRRGISFKVVIPETEMPETKTNMISDLPDKKIEFKLEGRFRTVTIENLGTKTIGKGSFGHVKKLVIDPVSKLSIAVKHLNIPMANDEGKRHEKLIQELKTLIKIASDRSCPYIIDFYGALRHPYEMKVCLMLEFMPLDLATAYKKFHKMKPFKKNSLNLLLRRVAYNILSALEFMSEHNLSHNDVKPPNILLDSKGQLKLTDFGESTDIKNDENSTSATCLGSFYYWAPEYNKRNMICSTERSHLWALGLTLLETSIGKHPYPLEMNEWECARYITSWRPRIPSEKISNQSNHFIRRLLQKRKRVQVTSYRDILKSRYLSFVTRDPTYTEINLFRSMISLD